MEVEFALREGFLIDSFYLDSGVLLTCIYFLITQNHVINLSLDSACHTNERIRIWVLIISPVEGRWCSFLGLSWHVSPARLYLPRTFVPSTVASPPKELLFHMKMSQDPSSYKRDLGALSEASLKMWGWWNHSFRYGLTPGLWSMRENPRKDGFTKRGPSGS